MSEGWGRLRKFLREKRIWIVSTLAVLIFSVWIVGGSESFQACKNGERPDYQNAELYKRIAFVESSRGGLRTCVGEFFEKNSEATIAAFTIILAISTIGLWWKTDELAKGAEKSFERQLRAYVSVEKFEITPIQNGHIFAAVLKNTGQTPTRRTRIHASWAPFENGLPDGFKYLNVVSDADGKGSFSLLGPNQTASSSDVEVFDRDIMRIADGKITALIWGWCEYDDVFGKHRHRTEFSNWIIVNRLSDGTLTILLKHHWEFNGADGDCMNPIET